MTYVLQPPVTPAVPVQGTDALFPVNRIYCVGRNYSDHVKEMGGDPKASPPVFFDKPADAVVINNEPVRYPQATSDLHHEVELVVALSDGGIDLELGQALACVYGYAVGVDFTRRDLQGLAKQAGKPWDVAKGFDQSAPVSAIRAQGSEQVLSDNRIWLSVNGTIRQDARLSEMIWSVPEIIKELSRLFELKPGDLIFTGTPAGVGATIAGDHIEAGIEGIGELSFDLLQT